MKRNWLLHSGWPISTEELDPYYPAEKRILGYAEDPTLTSLINARPFNGGALDSFPVYYGNPLSFSDIYKETINQNKNIQCVLNSTVSKTRLNATATQVAQLDVHTTAGRQFQVSARHFVLATGGLENARILLASSAHPGQGVLNAHDLVGRYHMEHPIRIIGVLDLAAPLKEALAFTNRQRTGGTTAQGSFGLSAQIRDREHLMNAHIRTFRYHPLENEAAIIAGKAAMQSKQHTHKFSEFSQYVRKHGSLTGKQILPYLLWHSWNKINPRAEITHHRFTAFLDQEPDPENRVTLSPRTDAFSNRLPHLSFSESDFMQEGVLRSMGLMAQTFAKSGVGTLRYHPEDIAH